MPCFFQILSLPPKLQIRPTTKTRRHVGKCFSSITPLLRAFGRHTKPRLDSRWTGRGFLGSTPLLIPSIPRPLFAFLRRALCRRLSLVQRHNPERGRKGRGRDFCARATRVHLSLSGSERGGALLGTLSPALAAESTRTALLVLVLVRCGSDCDGGSAMVGMGRSEREAEMDGERYRCRELSAAKARCKHACVTGCRLPRWDSK